MTISQLFYPVLSRSFALLFISLVLTACASEENVIDSSGDGAVQGATPAPVTEPPVEPAPVAILSVSVSKIKPGEETTLSWTSTDADSCEASGDWNGPRNTKGSQTIRPSKKESTYTLICDGAGGTTSDSVTVTMEDTPPPGPTVSISVSPSTITEGESTTLSWTSTGADSCVASGNWNGPRSTVGSPRSISPAVTSTYILSCTGAGVTVSDSATVTVNAPTTPAPTVSLSVSPPSISEGESATLFWGTTDADSCVASGAWSGARATSGSVSVSPAATSNYILTCNGTGGSTSDSVSVTVTAAASAHNATRANSYDDAWESAWIARAKTILATPVPGITKTVGKVLQVGDSMTYTFAYGNWARNKTGATASDLDTINWMHAGVYDATDGWNLSQNGTTAMNNAGWGSGFIDTIFIAADLNDAQFAVLMMNVPTSDPTNLTIVRNRIDQFIAVGIVPVLSTIPPRTSPTFDITLGNPYNEALRALAEELSLPLIDYSKEILLRRPDGTWENTLIGPDGVHPSGGSNGYTSRSDPYADGGDASTHTTGDAALNSGQLLRTWLTVQKMKEIKQKAVD